MYTNPAVLAISITSSRIDPLFRRLGSDEQRSRFRTQGWSSIEDADSDEEKVVAECMFTQHGLQNLCRLHALRVLIAAFRSNDFTSEPT